MLRPSLLPMMALLTASAFGGSSAARSDDPTRVDGYFCGSKAEHVAFLQRRAAGDSEEIAANVVNKAAGKQTCAYFLPADAIPARDQTVMDGGVVFKEQSYLFLPEKVERWTGSFFGSLQTKARFSEL